MAKTTPSRPGPATPGPQSVPQSRRANGRLRHPTAGCAAQPQSAASRNTAGCHPLRLAVRWPWQIGPPSAGIAGALRRRGSSSSEGAQGSPIRSVEPSRARCREPKSLTWSLAACHASRAPEILVLQGPIAKPPPLPPKEVMSSDPWRGKTHTARVAVRSQVGPSVRLLGSGAAGCGMTWSPIRNSVDSVRSAP